MNLTQIATVAAGEAERQDVGLDGLVRLLQAYGSAHYLHTAARSINKWIVLEQGALVEPGINRHGFRRGPVTFRNGGSSAAAPLINGLLDTLFKNLPASSDVEGINYWVKEFLWIHPFGDGNGRVAWILHNWLNDRLDSPVPLPDFGW